MFLHLATFWVLIPLFLGLAILKRKACLTFAWLLLLGSLLFSIAIIVVPIYWATNYPVFHTYTVVEVILIALLYQELLHSWVLRRIVRIVLVMFLLYKIADILWITTLSSPDYTAINVESFLVVILAILYFRQLFKERTTRCITAHPAFWINNANLFYFAGILVFSMSYLYGCGKDILWSRYFIHDYLLLLRNLLFTLAFWFAYRRYSSHPVFRVSDSSESPDL